jgi:hypothetical protein
MRARTQIVSDLHTVVQACSHGRPWKVQPAISDLMEYVFLRGIPTFRIGKKRMHNHVQNWAESSFFGY